MKQELREILLVNIARTQFEEAKAGRCVAVGVDHDVPGLRVVGHPLPSIVPLQAAVEILIKFLSSRTDHDQVAAPDIAGPARPLALALL